MQFLRTVFWVVLALFVGYFCWANQQRVQVNLWGGIAWYPPLWFAMICAFLVGLVPVAILHRATRWNLRRKLETANRSIVAAPATAPVRSDMAPPGAAPLVPPPGVA